MEEDKKRKQMQPLQFSKLQSITFLDYNMVREDMEGVYKGVGDKRRKKLKGIEKGTCMWGGIFL